MIKGENSRKDLERSLPTVYICSRYRPKSADPEESLIRQPKKKMRKRKNSKKQLLLFW